MGIFSVSPFLCGNDGNLSMCLNMLKYWSASSKYEQHRMWRTGRGKAMPLSKEEAKALALGRVAG